MNLILVYSLYSMNLIFSVQFVFNEPYFSVQFVFNEPDAAKYVWKICVLQHTFFKMHQV